MAIQYFRTRPFLSLLILYTALYAGYGTESPFFPSYMQSRSLTAEQIGYVYGAGTVIRLIAGPLLGRLADRIQGARHLLIACSAASAAVALSYSLASNFLVFLLISVCHSVMSAPLAPMADTLAISHGRMDTSFHYGWVRGAGSASFIGGTLLAGQLIAPYGLSIVVYLSAGLLTATALSALLLPKQSSPVPMGSRSERGPDHALKRLVTNMLFVRAMVVATLIIGSHVLNDTFAVITWSAAGISPGAASVLWSVSVLSEVIVFVFLGKPILERFGPSGAAMIAAATGVIRWIVVSQTTSLPVLACVQAMHGLTFALMHLVAVSIIADTVPASLATTAQTTYNNLCLGLASAILAPVSGLLYGLYGSHAFWAMAGLCALALPVAATLKVKVRHVE